MQTMPLARFIIVTSFIPVLTLMGIQERSRAATTLPKGIRGLWCGDSSKPDADEQGYLCNDASSPAPDTPCKKNGRTPWIEIGADGSYHGRDYACGAGTLTNIDRGVVIEGGPGANAVYGLDARCRGHGNAWSEHATKAVERWGSALMIKRTSPPYPGGKP